jgi:hypothetical protein
MIARHITANIVAALADTPVVVVHGARQTGKSTLVRELARTRGCEYITLDDATSLLARDSIPRASSEICAARLSSTKFSDPPANRVARVSDPYVGRAVTQALGKDSKAICD